MAEILTRPASLIDAPQQLLSRLRPRRCAQGRSPRCSTNCGIEGKTVGVASGRLLQCAHMTFLTAI